MADYYIDEQTGLLVFTTAYHIKRGYCCSKKCRHCPYEPRYGGGSELAEQYQEKPRFG